MLCKQVTQDGSMHRGGVERAVSGVEKVPRDREGDNAVHTTREVLESQGRCTSQSVQDIDSQGR